MQPLPVRDRAGNALTGFRRISEGELEGLGGRDVVPAALVVVEYGGAVLLVFDAWRRKWELPGGGREPGETTRRTAIRELREETGIRGVGVEAVAVAGFHLVAPDRHELIAVYRARLRVAPRLLVNDEVLDFRWWPPSDPVGEDTSPLDAEIARRVARTPTA
ncbi:NUDIX hydrolase [Saccharothrix longispora]|uniref:8-oxo-dGTP pyrophosphatase MutT (NUDIX family) n=1 Tax=Saccharothrix longispora TaxID=33920 RepID=A0ABU1PP55_9PSEU|nr:NUDIX hydrolase [Saccharothrix longispora]MDR6592456.1 8-oxo-dGTP pyrophosphatase MutT (NUDIX family) [Saccharothrix longispora]